MSTQAFSQSVRDALMDRIADAETVLFVTREISESVVGEIDVLHLRYQAYNVVLGCEALLRER